MVEYPKQARVPRTRPGVHRELGVIRTESVELGEVVALGVIEEAVGVGEDQHQLIRDEVLAEHGSGPLPDIDLPPRAYSRTLVSYAMPHRDQDFVRDTG